MACPDNINLENNVSGCYTIHKTLSDDPEESFALQGIAWPLRKAMKVEPALILTIVHNPTASPPNLAVNIRGFGPAKPSTRVETLDFEWSEAKNAVMGTVKSRAKVMEWEEVKDEYLREGWSEKTVIYSNEVNEKEGWEAKNVWGFMIVDGKRYYCRKTTVENKKGETSNSRVVHEYKPISA